MDLQLNLAGQVEIDVPHVDLNGRRGGLDLRTARDREQAEQHWRGSSHVGNPAGSGPPRRFQWPAL